MSKYLALFVALITLTFYAERAGAEDLVLAENGSSRYQIVLPDKAADEVVDQWLERTAHLMQAAFSRSGFEVGIVRESAKDAEKPGLYIGATEFAKKHGLKTDFKDWTYQIKAIGPDVAIVGGDRKDPYKTGAGGQPLAQLGSVKGVTDFLRDYAGVRFLFMTQAANEVQLGTAGEKADVDTRSIGFHPMKRIGIPADLDVRKTPALQANTDRNPERFYDIANNFFPLLSFVEGDTVHWEKVIPVEKYGRSHPEYFALLPDGRRASELATHVHQAEETNHCPTNPGVQDLMAAKIVELFDRGQRAVQIMPPDSFRLNYCNCDSCEKLFGGRADTWEEVKARGASGKLWQTYFEIAKRVAQKRPEARMVVWGYQDTPLTTITEVPENIIPKVQFGQVADFDSMKGVMSPSGFTGLEETFTGFGVSGRYLPERTAKYAAEIVQAMIKNHIQWSTRDGGIGNVPGLQGPAYYVFGRMMGEPSADWQELVKEFCDGAFGEVSSLMQEFYKQLHEQMALYSDFFGVQMPAWTREYGRSKYRGNAWHVMSQYPPEYLKDADQQLTAAQERAKDPDVKARLELLRTEFNYLRGLSQVYYLHSAWVARPSPENLQNLLTAIEDWYKGIEEVVGKEGSPVKSLPDWPQMKPLGGHSFKHAALQYPSYQQLWMNTCLNWDIAAIRQGILENPHRLSVPLVEKAPAMDSPDWQQAPVQTLRLQDDMPYNTIRTTFQALRDRENLYIRVKSLYPANHPEDDPAAKTEKDVFKNEYVEVALRPSGSKTIYRLAGNPAAGVRYDANYAVGGRGQLTVENENWNGQWGFEAQVTGKKGQNLGERTWTALFRIPFAELDAKTPAHGETWEFNVARKRVRPDGDQYMIWSNAPTVTEPKTLGKLVL